VIKDKVCLSNTETLRAVLQLISEIQTETKNKLHLHDRAKEACELLRSIPGVTTASLVTLNSAILSK
jgi:hypothetical protein